MFIFVSFIYFFYLVKSSIDTAASETNGSVDDLDEFKTQISESTFKECDKMTKIMKDLNESVAEIRHFQNQEIQFRTNVF